MKQLNVPDLVHQEVRKLSELLDMPMYRVVERAVQVYKKLRVHSESDWEGKVVALYSEAERKLLESVEKEMGELLSKIIEEQRARAKEEQRQFEAKVRDEAKGLGVGVGSKKWLERTDADDIKVLDASDVTTEQGLADEKPPRLRKH